MEIETLQTLLAATSKSNGFCSMASTFPVYMKASICWKTSALMSSMMMRFSMASLVSCSSIAAKTCRKGFCFYKTLFTNAVKAYRRLTSNDNLVSSQRDATNDNLQIGVLRHTVEGAQILHLATWWNLETILSLATGYCLCPAQKCHLTANDEAITGVGR